ncbi:thiamine pyrophosphate-dependent enzyme [Leucobacter sp. GX24907]
METIDEYVRRILPSLRPEEADTPPERGLEGALSDLFAAQCQSRHLDLAARALQKEQRGFYTIGSSGHESNAAIGLLSQVTDPALLHYRSGGFFAARALRAHHRDAILDTLRSLTCSADDPISGGRHKVFGSAGLRIIPQTSTIASHLPRAVGLAYAIDAARRLDVPNEWEDGSIALCSFGDASANHSTALGALNSAAYLAHCGIACPVLFVCEDNRIGISTRSPGGWPAAPLSALPGVDYWQADGDRPEQLLETVETAIDRVRATRRPGVLHLRTVRLMGHAGSDAEIAYRERRDILADYERDPLVATARSLVARGALTGQEALARYEAMGEDVADAIAQLRHGDALATAEEVVAPIAFPKNVPSIERTADPEADGRDSKAATPLTLADSINRALTELMADHPEALVFGEDVARKGGVYGVTRGLQKRYGARRVFDTVLDEQTVFGTALGTALAGFVPIPEIQYLAYLHNAEDQLRGEAASLPFFSNGQYANGMVVRIAGLAYQKGFGGHFHNDNSIAVLRDIPGLVIGIPAHPGIAPRMLRSMFALAKRERRVCVMLEPIARYHTKDLLAPGDGLWTAPFQPPGEEPETLEFDEIGIHGSGDSALIVTYGNGVYMSLQAVAELGEHGINATVLDLRWIAPLPVEAMLEQARRFSTVVVVDETRRSGGVGEGIVSALVEHGYEGRIARVSSEDSFIPLGPASSAVLVSPADIVRTVVASVA